MYYTLSAAELFCKARPDLQVDICLNTDSDLLAELVAQKYPEVVFLPRGEALGGDTVPKMAVFQDCLRRMEEKNACTYDAVMDLDITSPLRTAKDVQNAVEMKEQREDLDLVFSVTEARRNPYFNMVRDFLANNHTGILWDGKIGVTTMMDTGILDIDSEEDYRLMEVIAGHLYQNYPAFGEVRDHIRA